MRAILKSTPTIPVPYHKGHPVDIRGAHVVCTLADRTLLGEVVAMEYSEYPRGGFTLTVRHFNGEPWPINPKPYMVRILDRTWEGSAQ